ncbi:MAG TPA: hypothetical protein VK364_11755 [Hymenobacter sp.]|nr:hypothetical protein [Hymenobacter sp.]
MSSRLELSDHSSIRDWLVAVLSIAVCNGIDPSSHPGSDESAPHRIACPIRSRRRR